MRMVVLGQNDGGTDVRLSLRELVMINNALNEVCNGVHDLADDGEFQTRLGHHRSDLQRLLDQIQGLI
ncbi:hypothetical protein LJR164_004434 [Phenylobacterium sp. LjRoot164]|uniref:hypothetical protein n=1 Tax=unclassified Phenylobacterium TaxID=2640670 RepID=UPI003ECF5FAB